MGSHVSGFLKDKGYNIFITSRKKRENIDGVTYLQGNAKELTFITELCQRHWDVIIDFMVYSLDELKERIDMILESTNQYIFISSAVSAPRNSVLVKPGLPVRKSFHGVAVYF